MNRFYLHESDYTPKGRTLMITQRREKGSEWLAAAGLIVLLAIGFLGMLFAAWKASAQTTCTATSTTACFDASVKQGTFPIATTLVWSVPNAVSCTAGGAGSVAAWTGSVPASGTRALTGINVDMHLTLNCGTKGSILVSWVPGDPVTSAPVTGWRINYWQGTATPTTFDLDVPGATAYRIENVSPGPWFTSVLARSSSIAGPAKAGVPAPFTVVGGSFSGAVDIDGTAAMPNAPASVVVTEVVAYTVEPTGIGTRVAMTLLRSDCVGDQCTVLARRQ